MGGEALRGLQSTDWQTAGALTRSPAICVLSLQLGQDTHTDSTIEYWKGLFPEEGIPGHVPPETLTSCVGERSGPSDLARRGMVRPWQGWSLGGVRQGEVGGQGGALFLIFWPHRVVCGISVPRPGIEPVPPAVEAQSLNHWTARKVQGGAPGGPRGQRSVWVLPAGLEERFKKPALEPFGG